MATKAKRPTTGRRDPKAIERQHGIELRFDRRGELDELVAKAAAVHLERLVGGGWWLRVDKGRGSVNVRLFSTGIVHPIAEWD